MGTQDFFHFMKGINFSNLHKPVDSEGEKFSWLEIHELKYDEGLFGFKFRYNLTDEYRTCLLGKRSRKQVPNLFLMILHCYNLMGSS